jgi:hypothetical protein
MKSIQFILMASLITSFSLRAEERNYSQKALTKVGSVAKTTGRVAKVGGYSVLTAVSGVTTALPVLLLAAIGYELVAEGYVLVPSPEYGSVSFKEGSKPSDDFVGATLDGVSTAVWSATLASSIYGLSKLTKHFAQKTKEAAKEVRSS